MILGRLPPYRKRKDAEALLAREAARFHGAKTSSALHTALLREYVDAAKSAPVCLACKNLDAGCPLAPVDGDCEGFEPRVNGETKGEGS